MGWWNSIFRTRAQDWILAPLAPDQVPDPITPEEVPPDSRYLNVFLQSMRVVDVRKGLSRFYGTVHSYASLPHRSGTRAEFNVVTIPATLRDVDAKHVDRVISVGQRLLGPIPYRGGDLELEVGLFSIRSADYAAPFLTVLEQLSTLAGVSYVNAALAFAQPLRTGIDLLTGGNDAAILEIGLSADYARPRTGYSVVMRAPKGAVDVSTLRVTPTDYRLVDGAGRPVGQYPYMVLKVEAQAERDDWFMIPDIRAAHAKLKEHVRSQKFEEAKESLVVFRRTVLTSDDLLFADAQRLYQQVETETHAVLGTTTTSMGTAAAELRDLEEIPLYG